jgi:hypothetical protein
VDYPTTDPADGIVRSDFNGLVVPHNGDTPFQMTATGIQVETPDLLAILGGNSTGIAVPYGATYSGKRAVCLINHLCPDRIVY